jgi:S-adenosylmethionine:tRNA ribosyltransferase-isomerase
VEGTLNQIGFPPLPPYISRTHDIEQAQRDRVRYQTIYAEQEGAIAAPTAGLHFTQNLLDQLADNGIVTARVTLHVGVGTFKPIGTKRVEDHAIHSERVIIQEQAAETVNRTRRQGGRVFAVGTTSVRSLESAAVGCGADAELAPCDGPTRLFITPGYRFKLVDALITNFHLPRSSLLALVGAFADLDTIKAAYQHAIEREYRFFSYGDAMLIL